MYHRKVISKNKDKDGKFTEFIVYNTGISSVMPVSFGDQLVDYKK